MKIDFKRPRPSAIVLVSVYLFLLPFIIAVMLSGGSDFSFYVEVLSRHWTGLIFYGLLSLCVLSLNNKLRLGVVIILTSMALAGPVGMIAAVSQTWPKELDVVRMYGISVLLYPWVLVFGVSILFAIVPAYLTRPKIKELFN